MEEGKVQITRAAGSETFPARFMLVCAMNPCKCGWYGYSDRCKCNPRDVEKYQGKISGPMLDRVDLVVDVSPPDFGTLSEKPDGEPSRTVKGRVDAARALQSELVWFRAFSATPRWAGGSWRPGWRAMRSERTK